MRANQRSIMRSVTCCGVGVHSGKLTKITLKPAKPNTGIVFIRTDVCDDKSVVFASYKNVASTFMSTNISNQYQVEISTIEHLMAAIWGCGVDNLIIEIDGPEVPIMDGSSKTFVFMIQCSGIKDQPKAKKYIKIVKESMLEYNDSKILAIPSESLEINMEIDFQDKVIGKQSAKFSQKCSFNNDIAHARTFGFIQDLDHLHDQGLALGASLDNTIAIDKHNDLILNPEGLRDNNEFAKHKLLDFIGDISIDTSIIGTFYCNKTSHALNNEFMSKILKDSSSYKYVSL
ncbi:MAG: UDP-3-O-acyl-N-acetylglucosamine deacetylase [Rickettsiaceae bacterium]